MKRVVIETNTRLFIKKFKISFNKLGGRHVQFLRVNWVKANFSQPVRGRIGLKKQAESLESAP